MGLGIQYYFDEAKHRTAKTFRWVMGKSAQTGLRLAMGGGAASVASNVAAPIRDTIGIAQPAATAAATQTAVATSEVILSSVGGVLSIGLGAGLSGYLNHLDHKHYQQQLSKLYGNQIAALTVNEVNGQEKEPKDVTVDDLKVVAAQNPSLQTELDRNDKKRTLENTSTITGTLFAFALVLTATVFPPLSTLAAAAAGGAMFSSAVLTFIGVSSAIGYTALHFARKSIQKAGNKLLGLDKPSAVEKVLEYSRQKEVMPEQVMDVFVAANPKLAAEIEANPNYQKHFDDMSFREKLAVTIDYNHVTDAFDIASAINNKEISPLEMTFLAHDQFSGVQPSATWREKMMGGAQERIGLLRENATERFTQWKTERAAKREAQNENKVDSTVLEPPSQNRVPDWRTNIISRREAAADKGELVAGRA